MNFKSKNNFWDFIPKNRKPDNYYGRAINISIGLILGIIIDKLLFIITKGLSIFFPPFAALLMTKGPVLYSIRFEKNFPKIIEKFLSHFIS